MNSRSHQNLQKTFLTLVILCLIFPLVSIILHAPDIQPNKYMEEDQSKKLHPSPTTVLNSDQWTEIHDYANEYIDWSFSASDIINVWVLDSTSYSQFISTGLATGYHLTTSASGSGRFDVSSFIGQTWYVIFWNDLSGSQTTVTYNVVFEGERPPSDKVIIITKPNSSSELILGSETTIEWDTPDIPWYADMKITIYKGPDYLGIISSETENDGSHYWTVLWYHQGGLQSYRLQAGSDYRIKIEHLGSTAYNMSDYFSIITSDLTILEPINNSSYEAGELIEITWISDNLYDFLDIEIYKRNNNFYGDGYDFIDSVDQVPDTGYYTWSKTANLPSGEYFFKIFPSYFGAAMLDQSEDFTIVNESAIPGYSLFLVLGVSSLISSILIYRHLNIRKKLEK